MRLEVTRNIFVIFCAKGEKKHGEGVHQNR